MGRKLSDIVPEDIAPMIKEIRILCHDMQDHEAAHGRDEEMRDQVLRAIAAGASDPEALAKMALRTNRIPYKHW